MWKNIPYITDPMEQRLDDGLAFCYELLKLEDLYRFHTGAAQPGLAVKTLNQISIPLASLVKQEQYEKFYSQVDKSKLLHQRFVYT